MAICRYSGGMKYEHEQGEYRIVLSKLPHSVLDGLRGLVEYVDGAMLKDGHKNVSFDAHRLLEESGYLACLFGEGVRDQGDAGARDTIDWLMTDGGVFAKIAGGAVQVQFGAYSQFKRSLVSALKSQPHGYARTLRTPTLRNAIELRVESGKVSLVSGDKVIHIAGTDTIQGKLLQQLGNPFGTPRTIQSVLEAIGRQDDDVSVMQNAVKEIQRKLASHQIRKVLRLVIDIRSIRIEAL